MIAAIVCIDNNYGIGSNNDLLAHIPEDMKLFKEKTTGGTVVMGRKTYDSLPKKPLPNRTNIIITSKAKKRPKIQEDGTIHSSMKYIKAWLSKKEVIEENNGIYVIGGGQIYKELLPFCERVYVTKVFHSYENVDTYFPNIDKMLEWEMTSASEVKEYNDIKYQFCVYDRIDYEIQSVLNRNDNEEIEEGDLVVVVKTFNSIKNIIFSEKSKGIYIDDWEYIATETTMNKFFDEVKEFLNKQQEETKDELDNKNIHKEIHNE